MKKPLLIALIAATALVPVAASAQEWQGRRGGNRGDVVQRGGEPRARMARPDAGGGVDRSQLRQQWEARRAERAVAGQGGGTPRPDRGFARPDRPQPAPQTATPATSGTDRGQRDARRSWGGDRGPFAAERRDDRRDFNRERRDDRRDFNRERRDDRAALANGQVTRDQFRQDRRDDRRDFRADRRDDRRDFRNDRRDDRRDWRNDRRADWNRRDRQSWDGGGWSDGRGWAQGGRGGDRSWNRGWRSDRRYDWQGWRNSNRNLYRLPRYYAPRGYSYGYQRFSIGATLGAILFAQDYWINDPWTYRLPPVDGPFRWVRYYNDALLVDTYSGEVVDVIHDIFW